MNENINQLCREQCTGCGNCTAVCPEHLVKQKLILEGFQYPYVDELHCKMCGKCSDYCPCLNLEPVSSKMPAHKYAYAASDGVRWNQEDGGAIWMTMKYVLSIGGKVLAPFFSKDWRSVGFDLLDNAKDLEDRKIASRIECDVSGILLKLKNMLESQILIMFIGLPCQVAGVKLYLGKEYSNLFLSEITCRGVTSQKVWEDYLKMLTGGKPIQDIKFGAKERGWGPSLRVKYGETETEIYEEAEKDLFLSAYNQGISLRKSCLNCACSEGNGDIVFGNFYRVAQYKVELDDKKGISYIAAYSSKGNQIVEGLRNSAKILEAVSEDAYPEEKRSSTDVQKRDFFFEQWESRGWKNIDKYVGSFDKRPPMEYMSAIDYHVGDSTKWNITNSKAWQEKQYDGQHILFPDGKTGGGWILLPLNYELSADVKYEYDIRFKAQTTNRNVRFILTDKPYGPWQVIWEQNIPNNTWLRVKGNFIPIRNGWKYIFLSSTDFMGEGSYLRIDWIRIWEWEERV